MLFVSLVRDCGTSNQFGVPKETPTYVDADNLRRGADRGLMLPLDGGGFNAEKRMYIEYK